MVTVNVVKIIYIDEFIVNHNKWCAKQEPPSIVCELPDDLTNRLGTSAQTYTITSSMVSEQLLLQLRQFNI